MPAKAAGADFDGRFREIVSDPLNLLIRRHPQAGMVADGLVTLHNGHLVPLAGEGAYYGDFSRILVINRGVHEPLEELAFQCLAGHLPAAPVMIELGAYWGHYSMWMKQLRPAATVHLVEPDPANLAAGQQNMARNGHDGVFVGAFVQKGGFEIDSYMRQAGLQHLTLLHCDIQGFEAEMLEGAAGALAARAIDRLFVSTHSQALHMDILRRLVMAGYRIEISADFLTQTTSYDGFVMASSPLAAPVFHAQPALLGRTDILAASPDVLLESLQAMQAVMPGR